MRWISNVVFAILSAHIWGSLMLAIWLYAVRKLEDKGFTRLLFYLLRAVIVSYLFPLAFAVVRILNEIIMIDARYILITPAILVISLLLFIAWSLGFWTNFKSVWESRQRTKRWLSDALPASKERQEHFQEICRQTKMHPGRVVLCEKAGLDCGGVTAGIFHPKIVLPEGEMDEYVERVTLIHELIHYKRKDIWFLTAAKIVETIHWFNPWTRGLADQMSQWNEFACDWKVYNKYLGDMKAYSQVLVYTVAREQGRDVGLYSSIGTEPMKLTRRMQKMIKMENAKKRPKIFGVLAAVAVSLTSVVSALASTGIAAEGYRALYDLTEVEIEVNGKQVIGRISSGTVDGTAYPDNSNINPEDYVNTGTIFRDVLPLDGYTQMQDESGVAAMSVGGSINWDLSAEMMTTTGNFWVNSSEKVSVSGDIAPEGKIVRVGVIVSGGSRYCTYVSETFSHVFDSYGAGNYCVYAINDNSESVKLKGGYFTY